MGDKSILDQTAFVVVQKAKLFETVNEYTVLDAEGEQLGRCVQVGQSVLKRAIRRFSDFDEYMTHTLELRDQHGTLLLRITRPRTARLKSRVLVENGNGHEIGQIVQETVFKKLRFRLESGGVELGAITELPVEDEADYAIHDHTGEPLGSITETADGQKFWRYLLSSTADSYVVEVQRRLDDPLRSLVVAAAFALDLSENQMEL